MTVFYSDIVNGGIADVHQLGILESYNVKLCMLSSAAEAAEMVGHSGRGLGVLHKS